MLLHSHTGPLDKASMSQRLLDGPGAGEVLVLPFLVPNLQLGYETNPTVVGRSRR